MADISDVRVMTIEEFIRRYDTEGPFELIDGEIVPKMPTVLGHGDAADNLIWALNQHIRPNNLGKTYTESPFVLVYDKDWVKGSRVPDIMFVTAERIAMYQAGDSDWKSKPLVLVPDLVVEIVSPTDSYTEINTKVKRYLEDGVRLIWVVDPQIREIMVYTQASDQPRRLHGDMTLTGGDVLPGFEMSLKAIFG